MEGWHWYLLRQIRHGLELLLPVLGHLDGLSLHALSLRGHALLVGVAHDLREVVRVKRVEHVEEVHPRGALALWKLIREVLHELGVLQEHGIEGLDA